MRRTPTALALIFALALVGSACSKQRDTGFPPIPTASPSTSASASVPTTPVTAVTLIAKNISWDASQLLFKANSAVTVTVDNQDAGVPHNFAIWSDPNRLQNEIYTPKKDVTGPAKADYVIPPLKAGTYYFECDIHKNMNGTLKVSG
jgi:plastocyanin